MEDRYFFDKRVMKKILLKYGIMFLCVFPVLVLINYFLNKVVEYWVTIIIDVTFILLVLFAVQLIENKIKENKENKEEDIVVIKAKQIKEKRKNVINQNNNETNNSELNNKE